MQGPGFQRKPPPPPQKFWPRPAHALALGGIWAWVWGWLWISTAACLAPPTNDAVTLKVGDAAPPFVAGRWLQGKAPERPLTQGVAVVLFWKGGEPQMPTGLSRMEGMRQKFSPKGVTFLGVRVWEPPQAEWDPGGAQDGLEVEMPLMADGVNHTNQGTLARTWLEPAGITAAPVVFVLHQGRMAWIGHPFGLREKTLLDLLAGAYDWERAVREYAAPWNHGEALEKRWKVIQAALENSDWPRALETVKGMIGLLPPEQRVGPYALQFQFLMASSRMQDAEALATQLVEQYPEELHLLNLLAWEMATNDDFENPNVKLILKIAERANEAAYGRDANILDTYARALFLDGQKTAAIQAQMRAIQLAPPNLKPRFEDVLKHYQRGELPPSE